MKVFYKLLLASLLLYSCSESPLQNKIAELDHLLAQSKDYTAKFEAGAVPFRDSLKNATTDAARWEAAREIYSIYKCIQMDSARFYLRMMRQLSEGHPKESFFCRIEEASINISARNYQEARSFLASVDTSSLSGKDKNRYYETIMLLYATEAIDETLPQDVRDNSIKKRYEMRRQYIASSLGDPFEAVRRPAIQMYEDGNATEAIPILKNLAETSEPGLKAHACYSLAKAFQAAGMREETEYWFAQSAIESILRPSGEHLALYELSMMLFDDQNLKRALAYNQAVLESELESHYNIWIINSASSQLGIVNAVLLREKHQKKVSIIITIVISLLSLIFFATGLVAIRQAQKIRAADAEIRLMNHRLEEAGKIKEGYVFRYIILSSQYLRMVEDYRHSLRVTLKEEGIEGLKKELRQNEIKNLNSRQFYAIFDETFLGIFPDFVSHVNSLLKEEARFQIKEGKELPTGLRILAAIKLGITDCGKIAEFLDCAVSSVYTHRSRMRHAAACAPEDFERLVTEA
jgi:tetratricopeptide (TPR) repeat protein